MTWVHFIRLGYFCTLFYIQAVTKAKHEKNTKESNQYDAPTSRFIKVCAPSYCNVFIFP